MANATDMATPVTRGELREELTQLRQELEQKLAPLATKSELEIWGGALLSRIESSERRLIGLVTERIESSEQRLHAELARHTNAIQESMTTLISAIDEKYADLPSRVARLETTVFASERR